jgi:hypothetical protein
MLGLEESNPAIFMTDFAYEVPKPDSRSLALNASLHVTGSSLEG